MDAARNLVESPLTALFVTLALAAIAINGKFSVTASQLLFGAAFIVACLGLRSFPIPQAIGLGLVILGVLILVAWWARPDAIPGYSGVLTSKQPMRVETLFSPVEKIQTRKLEIGDSETIFVDVGLDGKPFFDIFGKYKLLVESVNGELNVSTSVADKNGHLIAEIYRNEWKVAPPPNTWDRNYNANTLEVRDSSGRIVLQVRLLPDRIQIQGEWQGENGQGFGLKKCDPHTPEQSGCLEIIGPAFGWAQAIPIKPLFIYPGGTHLGELARSRD